MSSDDPTAECCCCFMSLTEGESTVCDSPHDMHSYCPDCCANFLRTALERGDLSEYVPCPMCNGKLSQVSLLRHLTPDMLNTIRKYAQAKGMERANKELEELRNKLRNSGDDRCRIGSLLNELAEYVTPCCPKCGLAIFDFTGCIDVHCGDVMGSDMKVGCGTNFCGLCLEERPCAHGSRHLFFSADEISEAHQKWKQARLNTFCRTKVPSSLYEELAQRASLVLSDTGLIMPADPKMLELKSAITPIWRGFLVVLMFSNPGVAAIIFVIIFQYFAHSSATTKEAVRLGKCAVLMGITQDIVTDRTASSLISTALLVAHVTDLSSLWNIPTLCVRRVIDVNKPGRLRGLLRAFLSPLQTLKSYQEEEQFISTRFIVIFISIVLTLVYIASQFADVNKLLLLVQSQEENICLKAWVFFFCVALMFQWLFVVLCGRHPWYTLCATLVVAAGFQFEQSLLRTFAMATLYVGQSYIVHCVHAVVLRVIFS